MKTKLITTLFLFLTYQLTAQFHFKVSMDETGLYAVKLKSDVAVNPGSLVGSGQISLTASLGDFKIGQFTSVTGSWNKNFDFYNEFHGVSLDKNYFFVGLKDGDGMVDKGMEAEEEIVLFTFRNIGTCTGSIELINDNDKLLEVMDSIYKDDYDKGIITCWGHNPQNDLSIFDTLAQALYKFSGNYDLGQATCNSYVDYSPIEEIVKLEVDERGPHQFSFRWSPIVNTSFYELKIRKKGKLNWEQRLISTKPTTYLYSPQAGKYEYQILAHQNTKVIQSKIEGFSNQVVTK